MALRKRLRGLIVGVWRDRNGIAAIEFALLFPLLLVVVTAAVVLFLFFRDAKTAERSTFTISDILSRRTEVDQTFLQSTYQLFLSMTGRPAADVRFRVSSLIKTSTGFSVSWSYAVSPLTTLEAKDVPVAKAPLVTTGDSVLLIETQMTPPSAEAYLPISVSDYTNAQFVRPRFTSAISKTN